MAKKKTATNQKPKKTSGIKPIVSDGYHFRWYYHPTFGWQIVEVSPWNNYQCVFNRPGFPENPSHWVKRTQSWQWGPRLPDVPILDLNHKIPSWVGTTERACKLVSDILRGDD